jgi:hypothetical protein
VTTAAPPPPTTCAKCQRALRSHFKIERVHHSGSTTVSASLCSIPCVISWAYGYATMVGMMGAAKAKSLIDTVLDALQGKR